MPLLLHKNQHMFICSPCATGWIMKLELNGDSGLDELMDVDAYEQHVKEAV